jgi:hypothetical protein
MHTFQVLLGAGVISHFLLLVPFSVIHPPFTLQIHKFLMLVFEKCTNYEHHMIFFDVKTTSKTFILFCIIFTLAGIILIFGSIYVLNIM